MTIGWIIYGYYWVITRFNYSLVFQVTVQIIFFIMSEPFCLMLRYAAVVVEQFPGFKIVGVEKGIVNYFFILSIVLVYICCGGIISWFFNGSGHQEMECKLFFSHCRMFRNACVVVEQFPGFKRKVVMKRDNINCFFPLANVGN